MNKDLLILGGGPAGMAAGYYAFKKGLTFSIIEASKEVGGNCKTLSMGNFKYDTGAHRLHNKDENVTHTIRSLLKNDIHKVSTPSTIFWENKRLAFPLELKSIIKSVPLPILLKIIAENVFKNFKRRSTHNNFKQYAYDIYGKTLSNLFLINYTEKLWGENTELLSSTVSGNRLKGLNFSSLFKSIFSKKNMNENHIDGSFYYPKDGFGSIFEALFSYVGKENIFLKNQINKIELISNNNYRISTKNGKVFHSKKIICTLPPNIYMNIIKPSPPLELIEIANSLKFRSIRLSVIGLNREKFSDSASIYFPEKKYPFTRIYEPKNRSKHLAPKNQTCLVVEVPCFINDKIYKMKNETFNNYINSFLFNEDLILKDEILQQQSFFMEHAYPQQLVKDNQIKKVISFAQSLPGFAILGRNANFKYLHTHDLFNYAESCVDEMISDLN